MKAKLTVLVVDDDETFCRFLAEVLEAEDYSVQWTTDGLDGFGMSLDQSFDLFIVDVRMPLIVGTELAEEIRTDHPEARIILTSAFADEQLAAECRKLKVALLSKPFSRQSLLGEMRRLTKR